MNELSIKLSVEQLSMVQTLLKPYVELYQSISQQYIIQEKQELVKKAMQDKKDNPTSETKE